MPLAVAEDMKTLHVNGQLQKGESLTRTKDGKEWLDTILTKMYTVLSGLNFPFKYASKFSFT